MENLNIPKLKEIFGTLSNDKRLRIIALCSERPHTLKELSKELALNYSITIKYVRMLEKLGLIKKERNKDKAILIKSLIRIKKNGR